MNNSTVQTGARIIGGLAVLAGIINVILAPLIGETVFENLWGVEPFAYIGAVLVMAGLGLTSLSYLVPHLMARKSMHTSTNGEFAQQWSRVTQQYFELFDHDLGRPLRRILGKERELRAVLGSLGATEGASNAVADAGVRELLDEIESQAPNFRLMMSNIQVLVRLEAPHAATPSQAVEPSEVVRRIVDRYTAVASESQKEISWWSEPSEFGIVYSDTSAIEHMTTNLVDNAVRFATSHIEIKLTKNPTHFFIRVWDDGPGIAPQYLQHIFDRGWTPEVAKREEKSSSGLGLFIARSLAHRQGGELTVESSCLPDPDHHTAFLLSLPLRELEGTLP